jgi:hypothetical protein
VPLACNNDGGNGGQVNRSRDASIALTCLAFALLILTALATNLARLGSVIAREIQRAQIDYMQETGSGASVENNALLLGQCLRREMLKSAQAGFVYSDTWAVAARVHSLPLCVETLPSAAPPSAVPANRVRARGIAVQPTGNTPTIASNHGS